MSREKSHRFSFQSLVVFVFIPLIIVMVVLTGLTSFYLAESAQKTTVTENAKSLLHLSCGFLDNRLSGLVSTIINIRDSQAVETIARDLHDSGTVSPSALVQMQEYLDSVFARSYDVLESVQVYFQQAPNVTFSRSFHHPSAVQIPWDTWEKLPKNTLMWEPLGAERIANGFSGASVSMICVSREGERFLVKLVFSERFIENTFSHLFYTDSDRIVIIGDVDRAFSFNSKNEMTEIPTSLVLRIKEGTEKKGAIQTDHLIVVYDSLNVNSWKIAMCFDTSEIFHDIDLMKQINALAVTIIALLSVAMSILFARRITKPLSQFATEVSSIDVKNLENAHIEKPAMCAEVCSLSESLDNLIARTQVMVEERKHEQEDRMIMQNRLLLAQINPHFLYNTLYAIAEECNMGETKEASKMLYELAAFFRLGLNSGKELVTIRDEIEHARNYLELIACSLSQDLSFTFDVPSELMGNCIPKMTLQPIVENSVKHGIRNKRGPGSIAIRAVRHEREVIVTVTDTGIGMEEKTLSEQRSALESGRMGSGFGMWNVNQRVQSFFGRRFGLTIDSKIGEGTTIGVRLPLQKMGEMEK